MRLYPILILFLLTTFCFGQTKQNGLILPLSSASPEICCIYAPKNGITVYSRPNGDKAGKLTRKVKENTGDQAPYRIYLLPNSDKAAKKLNLSLFEQIDSEVWAIKYFERKDGFVRVLDKSDNYWISEKEIAANKFRVTEWQKFISANAGKVLGFYANDPGLNLRDAPSVNGKVLKKLKGDLFEITPTTQSKGLWVKVKVKKYKEHPCTSDLGKKEIVDYELEGWVKIVNDNGEPNVWYYARGC
ncbi:hypothetical protein [Rufibacter latericius]|uniref:SH3 domain-containing protein n=1 Tax=Rufibacter latericius TaxID=2487040 RepID=A0A3M9MF14_9BACT|nr:hypothetical protein [Rufibacter latericius]RNI23717.1 hypothetical protein EFB08_19535 [Rufibacter latericius]